MANDDTTASDSGFSEANDQGFGEGENDEELDQHLPEWVQLFREMRKIAEREQPEGRLVIKEKVRKRKKSNA